ncbi:MAG: antitoxin [Candidatus Baltobacteraceae bacterium]
MYTTNLRKVGGSVMLAVPPPILDLLHLRAGATVGMAVEGDHLVIEARRARYKLDDLLARCDPSAPLSPEDREWVDSAPVGTELI